MATVCPNNNGNLFGSQSCNTNCTIQNVYTKEYLTWSGGSSSSLYMSNTASCTSASNLTYDITCWQIIPAVEGVIEISPTFWADYYLISDGSQVACIDYNDLNDDDVFDFSYEIIP